MNNIIVKNRGRRSLSSIVRRSRGRLSRRLIAAVGLVGLIALVGCQDNAVTTIITDDYGITYVGSVDDSENSAYNLNSARSVTTASIGSNTYLFVSGVGVYNFFTDRYDDGGVSVFQIANNGSLIHVNSVNDSEDDAYEIYRVGIVTTALIGSNTFLFVTGTDDNGVSVFRVANNGELTHADSVDDSENAAYKLDGAVGLTTALIGSSTFLFVAGTDDNGVSVFQVANNGKLTHVDSVDDSENDAYELDHAYALTTAAIGSNTYLFAAGDVDHGVSVFRVANNGSLTHADSVDDSENPSYKLKSADALTTVTIGSNTYLYVAGGFDNGVSVFQVASNGSLTHVDSVDDFENPVYELKLAISLTTATIGGNTHLFVGGGLDNGVSIFQIANNGSLTHVDSVDDSENDAYELEGVSSVTTASIGSKTYFFVSGLLDDGVSVFSFQ